MSCKELIESLRQRADERVSKLWADAEGEAGVARADVARRLGQLRADGEKHLAAATRAAEVKALSEANNRARAVRLSAEQELARRLRAIATALLSTLRTGGYETAFGRMAREIPALEWETVRVHPDDAAAAGKIFPGAAIVSDRAISGGVDASAEDGSIRVINTLEKRLDRAWDELLPLLIKDVYEETDDGAPSQA